MSMCPFGTTVDMYYMCYIYHIYQYKDKYLVLFQCSSLVAKMSSFLNNPVCWYIILAWSQKQDTIAKITLVHLHAQKLCYFDYLYCCFPTNYLQRRIRLIFAAVCRDHEFIYSQIKCQIIPQMIFVLVERPGPETFLDCWHWNIVWHKSKLYNI